MYTSGLDGILTKLFKHFKKVNFCKDIFLFNVLFMSNVNVSSNLTTANESAILFSQKLSLC